MHLRLLALLVAFAPGVLSCAGPVRIENPRDVASEAAHEEPLWRRTEASPRRRLLASESGGLYAWGTEVRQTDETAVTLFVERIDPIRGATAWTMSEPVATPVRSLRIRDVGPLTVIGSDGIIEARARDSGEQRWRFEQHGARLVPSTLDAVYVSDGQTLSELSLDSGTAVAQWPLKTPALRAFRCDGRVCVVAVVPDASDPREAATPPSPDATTTLGTWLLGEPGAPPQQIASVRHGPYLAFSFAEDVMLTTYEYESQLTWLTTGQVERLRHRYGDGASMVLLDRATMLTSERSHDKFSVSMVLTTSRLGREAPGLETRFLAPGASALLDARVVDATSFAALTPRVVFRFDRSTHRVVALAVVADDTPRPCALASANDEAVWLLCGNSRHAEFQAVQWRTLE